MGNQTKHTVEEELKHLGKLVKNIKVAMLNTVDEDGHIHGRPMFTQQMDSHGDFWFLTAANSHKAAELNKSHQVQLNFVSPQENIYVSASGIAEIIKDKEKIKEIWQPTFKAWFPEGLADPNIACLKVHIEQAEYWDSFSSTMVHLIGTAKALLTGEPYKPSEKEHKKVNLSR